MTDLQQSFVELKSRGQVKRFLLNQEEHRLGRDPQWADFVLPNEGWEALSSRHAVFRRQGTHYRIYDGDGLTKASTNGIFTEHRRITTQTGYLLDQPKQFQIGLDPRNLIVLTYLEPGQDRGSAIFSKLKLNLLNLQEWPVELGSDVGQRYAAMALPSPTVSRHHASISHEANQFVLRDHSTNGTFVNHQRLDAAYTLKERDTIQIGPYTLLWHQGVLELVDSGDQIRIDAHQLLRKVPTGKGEKVILNQVSLAIEPKQLVAFVGGSGAGKSTLMKTLLGIEPLTSGQVLLNGDDIRQHFDRYRSEIGYVPQDDIVHQNLTVMEVLTYACQLRLPPHTDSAKTVAQALQQVQLSHVSQELVQNLSGGQRKRVSIAVELLANPKLFFLDEPTSGLDPGLDKTMMNLLRELSDQGRTIILVTHATSNLEVCDHIAFMGQGGHLCFFGPPKEALTFFQMPSADFKYFSDIYIELGKGDVGSHQNQAVEFWSGKFLQSDTYQKYVQRVLSGGEPSGMGLMKSSLRQGADPWWQGWVLSQRYLTLVLREHYSLILLLFTAPVGIGLITFALQDRNSLVVLANANDPMQAPLALRVLFIFTCAAMWVGFSSTSQTIVQEAQIYARERLVNLRLWSYLGSKVLIHAALAIVQVILVLGVIQLSFNAPEPSLIGWGLGCGITTYLTLFASLSFGLMVSAFVNTSIQAASALPLILIPQIVFSGVLFDLEGIARFLSWLMISRWSVGAYGALVDVNAMVPKGLSTSLFQVSKVYDPTWANLSLNWEMLCLLSVVYLSITIWKQQSKDRQ
ncbi:ATP-binding cassette domain-containing protein [Acaryochloris sp. 'Moss Beach']|uniref:ATP-binding cassette domain-containing protein n=1 Tax=Acaryochloris sp. 'Moss Beach' TaxID=2740837 RepID=UPI001F3F95A7|nr:ATP-binding cassette domain-containing protein [Acaryochloris sp. 'Moss Beach']UJB68002.1 ATP-binding cassette domain-containing protein [Acaryochloris sp. 'Moss Beach']